MPLWSGPVQAVLLDLADERPPSSGREAEGRLRRVLAVAHADMAVYKMPDLDAIAICCAVRAFSP